MAASALTTYICPREAAKAIDWYGDVFGAVEEGDRYVEPDGRIGHASINIDGAQIMLADAYPDYGSVSPEPGNTSATYALNVYVPDVDATMLKAEERGAVVTTRRRSVLWQPAWARSSIRSGFAG